VDRRHYGSQPGFAITTDHKLSLFSLQRKSNDQQRDCIEHPEKTYMSENSFFWRIHDPSGVAEEKEENGGQRRPEKGQESLET